MAETGDIDIETRVDITRLMPLTLTGAITMQDARENVPALATAIPDQTEPTEAYLTSDQALIFMEWLGTAFKYEVLEVDIDPT